MDSEKTVNLAPVRGSSSFNQLKDVDLVSGVPRELFESPPPLTHMFSAFGCGYLHELLRAVLSDSHDVRPKEVDLLPLVPNRSSCDVLLVAKPVLCRDFGFPGIHSAPVRCCITNRSLKVAKDP